MNMEEKRIKLTEEEIRKLTKPEMARVEGGGTNWGPPDPNIKCIYCDQCFSTKTELMVHMASCKKKK